MMPVSYLYTRENCFEGYRASHASTRGLGKIVILEREAEGRERERSKKLEDK